MAILGSGNHMVDGADKERVRGPVPADGSGKDKENDIWTL